ncbi:hypothetical protein CRG98_021903 [Punica granatum]|uniref:Uncharacterized protein n=1 Tax=Punica granatum TaxID=22663 RepID=A0A2I0JN52_PUNGR|nr:hypothetical protein CRG98_021903 [Punica granatum]
MQNQRAKPRKSEEGECMLKVNAESRGKARKCLARKGEEGECLFKLNAESKGKAQKCEEGGACLK